MDETLFALTPLPVEGQLALLRTDAPAVYTALATSPHLDPRAARYLHDFVAAPPSAVWASIRLIDDAEMLENYVHKGSLARRSAAARNLNTPVPALEAALESEHHDVRLSALLNPRSPVELRRIAASPEAVSSMVNVGSCLADSVVRAAELVLNNPFLAEDPSRFDKTLHRAVACSPHSSPESVSSLSRLSKVGSKFVKRHPLLLESGSTWESFTTQELAGFEHPAADLVALARPDLDLATACSMFSRRSNVLEPQVIPRFLRRFGFAVAVGIERYQFSHARLGAGTWVHPAVEHLGRWDKELTRTYTDCVEAVAALGTSEDAWSMVATMLKNWHLDAHKLATTAMKLSSLTR
jgi:hypothetical protein